MMHEPMNDTTPSACGPLIKAPRKSQPFGWEVEVEYHPVSKKPSQTFHWRGCSRQTAYVRGLMKVNVCRIVSIQPVDEARWIAAYGIGRM